MYNFVVDVLGFNFVVSKQTMHHDLRVFYPDIDFDVIQDKFYIFNVLKSDISNALKDIPRVNSSNKKQTKLISFKNGLYRPLIKYDVRKAYFTLFTHATKLIIDDELQRTTNVLVKRLLKYSTEPFAKFLNNYLITNILIRNKKFSLIDFRHVIDNIISKITKNTVLVAREIDGFYTQDKNFRIPQNLARYNITSSEYKWVFKNQYIRILFNCKVKFDSFNRNVPNVILLTLLDIVKGRKPEHVIDKYFKDHAARVIDYGIKTADGNNIILPLKTGNFITLEPTELTDEFYRHIDYDYYVTNIYTRYFDLIEAIHYLKKRGCK